MKMISLREPEDERYEKNAQRPRHKVKRDFIVVVKAYADLRPRDQNELPRKLARGGQTLIEMIRYSLMRLNDRSV